LPELGEEVNDRCTYLEQQGPSRSVFVGGKARGGAFWRSGKSESPKRKTTHEVKTEIGTTTTSEIKS